MEIFGEVFEGKCGKVPCYNTVENWMKKLGLSVYENDRTPCRGGKYAVVVDESIFINSEKLLLLLGIPARHKGEPVKHEDVTVIGMKVSKAFNGDDIKQEIEEAATKAGRNPKQMTKTRFITALRIPATIKKAAGLNDSPLHLRTADPKLYRRMKGKPRK